MPLLLQTEGAECGLMCIAMVAGYYGETPEVAYLRREHRISMKGASFEQLMRIAAILKMSSRALRVDTQALRQLPKPCVLHWDEQHFVVLVKTGRRNVVINDPAFGVRKLSWAQLERHFSGAVLELTPTHEFTEARQQTPPKMKFWELTGKVVGLKKSLWQLFALGLGIEAVVLVLPFFMQWVTDHAVVTGDKELLLALVWGFAALIFIRHVLEAVRAWAVTVMSTWFNVQWMANVFSHLLRLPILYYERRHLGDIMSRFGVIGHIQNTLTTNFISAVLDGLMVIGTLVMMLLYSLPLSVLVITATLLYCLVRWIFYSVQRRLGYENLMHAAKQESIFMESLRVMPTIRVNRHEPARLANWMNRVVNTKNSQLQQQKYGIIFQTSRGMLSGMVHVAVIGLGALAILEGKFSVGMLLAFSAYSQQFGERSMGLVDRLLDLRLLEVQGRRLIDIVNQKPEQALDTPFLAPVGESRSLELRDFRFRYGESDTAVLLSASFQLQRGQLLVIQGTQGSGKTTLVHALMGFFPMAGGDAYLGGISAKKMGLHHYRDQIAVVLTDDKLMAGNVAENICLFDPSPDIERIEAIARMVGLQHDINQMPMRYFTVVGDMGSALSSAQRFKICLARALYRKPQFLILDSTFSGWDARVRDQLLIKILAQNIGIVMTTFLGDLPTCTTQALKLEAGKLHKLALPLDRQDSEQAA